MRALHLKGAVIVKTMLGLANFTKIPQWPSGVYHISAERIERLLREVFVIEAAIRTLRLDKGESTWIQERLR